ncbi:hypothetical protein L9F63_014297, partial [Diploptera punctata]
QSHGGTSPGRDEDSLSTQLHHFLASLTKSRGFYANLAESLCSDESFRRNAGHLRIAGTGSASE